MQQKPSMCIKLMNSEVLVECNLTKKDEESLHVPKLS